MREVQAAEITQLDPLQVAPEAFARIQLRRIGGQSLEVEALRRAVGQECLDGMAAMMAPSWLWKYSLPSGEMALMADR